MSVHAAYKALMESRVPSKQDVIMQGMCREWIWEFLLKHCTDSDLIRALAIVYPVPDGSLRLKRLLLLKSLSFNLSEDQFSDRTLETISALSSIYRAEHRSLLFQVPVSTSDGKKVSYQFTLQQLLLAVRVECTIQYLRADTDDWPKFYESLEKCWGEYADDTQEPEHDDGDDYDTFLELKKELWAVQKKPELRHELLKKHKRGYTKRMMQSFLSDAWNDAGHAFLEGVAQNLSKGLYVPGVEAEKTSSGKSMHVKSSHAQPLMVSVDEIVGTSIPKGPNEKPSGTIPDKPSNISMAKLSSNNVNNHIGLLPRRHADTSSNVVTRPSVLQGSSPSNAVDPTALVNSGRPSIYKNSEKGPDFPGRQSLESVVDPRDLLGCTEAVLGEQKHAQLESLSLNRRRIPMSLKERKKADSNTDLSEAARKADMRVTRSSSAAGIGGKDAGMANGAFGFQHEPLDGPLSGRPGLKDTCIAEAGEEQPVKVTEQIGRDAQNPEEEQMMCPSPPPWTGSPGMNDMITTRKRPRLAPFVLNEANTSKTVADVGEIGHIDTPVILKAQSELRKGQANLVAVVQDPFPEALKIAEEAAKVSNLDRQTREKVSSVDGKNPSRHSMLNDKDDMVQGLQGALQNPQEKPSKKSIMDRNTTAHTVEWESSDDIANSSDDQSPSHSRRVRLPKIHPRQSFASRGARNEPRRRKFQRWTEEETNILRTEVERYGKGHWKHILQKHRTVFESRTEVDLKDKWRNIERREGIL